MGSKGMVSRDLVAAAFMAAVGCGQVAPRVGDAGARDVGTQEAGQPAGDGGVGSDATSQDGSLSNGIAGCSGLSP